MAFGTFQPFEDVTMTLVLMGVGLLAHALSLVRR
jgi:hypothetical protein